MSTINLAKNYRLYSPKELREYAYKGLLEVNGFDMSDVLEYLFTGYEKTVEQEKETEGDKRYNDGWEDAVNEMRGQLENM